MAFTEDHTAFLGEDGFAVPASVGGSSVSVIFDHDYIDAQGVSGEHPIALCDDSDISSVSVGDAMAVNSGLYAVRSIEPDGTGMTILILEVTTASGISLGDTRTTEAGATRITEAGDTRITG